MESFKKIFLILMVLHVGCSFGIPMVLTPEYVRETERYGRALLKKYIQHPEIPETLDSVLQSVDDFVLATSFWDSSKNDSPEAEILRQRRQEILDVISSDAFKNKVGTQMQARYVYGLSFSRQNLP